jgi:hypothetical protein
MRRGAARCPAVARRARGGASTSARSDRTRAATARLLDGVRRRRAGGREEHAPAARRRSDARHPRRAASRAAARAPATP